MPDDQLLECVSGISAAWRLLSQDDDARGSIEKADTAMVDFMRYLCLQNNATESSEIQDPKRGPIKFKNWGFSQFASYLSNANKLPNKLNASFSKVHLIRNDTKYQKQKPETELARRAIAVVEYAVRSELLRQNPPKLKQIAEGGKFVLPKTRLKIVSRKEAKAWEKLGWYPSAVVGSKVELEREAYKKWEKFEMRVRYLLILLGFDDCIEDVEDFHYTKLGPQIDACGGSDGIFFVFDCTSSEKPDQKGLRTKLHDLSAKRLEVSGKIDKLYPGRYHTKVFVVCAEDVEVTDADKLTAHKMSIKILSSDQVAGWYRYYTTLGMGLKYHLVRSLADFPPVIADDENDPFYHFPSFRFVRDQKILYHFLADPETLLKVAYVYRLDLDNPEGYQRPLKRQKILEINDFLSEPGNYFANNLVVCFDSLNGGESWPDFEAQQQAGYSSTAGILHVPKQYCSAEVIDGQHRLYGYLDSTEDQEFRSNLDSRRKTDRLSVVAVIDPDETERPRLFTDINANQTKVDPRQLWALMEQVRPHTLMGFAAQIVITLNDGKVFKNKIHIPGITKRGKPINIANLGKGLLDRKLLDKNAEDDWNIYYGNRNVKEYDSDEVEESVAALEEFFGHFLKDPKLSKFVLTNNGANVMLRVLVQILKFEKYVRKKKLSYNEIEQTAVRAIKDMVLREGPEQLVRRTSNEAARGDLAREVMREIRRKPSMTSFAGELFDRR